MKKVVIAAVLGCAALLMIVACVGVFTGPSVAPKSNGGPALELPETPVVNVTPKRSASPDMIQEGTWVVGEDVKAGRYKTLGATDSMYPLCYWEVRRDSETGEIMAQGVKDKVSAQGVVTLKNGQYFNTSGCSDWMLQKSAKPAKLTASARKVYVIQGAGLSGWPVASAQAFIDRYTGSNWVMARSCPVTAYRCIWVVKDNSLVAPTLAATYGYDTPRVTIRVDVAYSNSRGITGQNKRKNVLAHEFGHAGMILTHSGTCGNVMYASTSCIGWSLTGKQRATLAAH